MIFGATLRLMVQDAGGERKTDAQARFKALWRRALDEDIGDPLPRAGVTPCGRYAYRRDDQGRFYAVLLQPPDQGELPTG